MNAKYWEWIASLMAGAGSAWFTHEITRSFYRLYLVIPPTGGPTEVIGISVLVWLYAKHQRYLLTLPAPALSARV